MNPSTNTALHRHLLDGPLNAVDDNHPIKAALRCLHDLPAHFEDTSDYGYIGELSWSDPQDGTMKPLSDDHQDEIYSLHLLFRGLLESQGRQVCHILMAKLRREDFLKYHNPEDDHTAPSLSHPHDQSDDLPYHRTTDTDAEPTVHRRASEEDYVLITQAPRDGGDDTNGKQESSITTWRPGNHHHSATHCIRVSSAISRDDTKSLIDRGANGGIAGDDMRIISHNDPPQFIDIQGIDNHSLSMLKIGTFGAVATTQRGEVILVFHQYAHHGRGKSIHSCLQLEDNGILVDDRSSQLGGKQVLQSPEGHVMPLDFQNGLAYLKLRPFKTKEWNELQHIHMTRDLPWAPTRYDAMPSKDNDWFAQQDDPHSLRSNFDTEGRYTKRTIATKAEISPSYYIAKSACAVLSQLNETYIVGPYEANDIPRDYRELRPFFLNMPPDTIKRTFMATTTNYRSIANSSHLRDTRKSPFPATNVDRRNEPVATDTIHADVAALCTNDVCAQIFVGRKSRFCDVYGCKTDKQFVDTLEDVIRQRGAMDKLISDHAQAEISRRVNEVLRAYHIKDWQSEPYHQNQNYAERFIQEVKRFTNWVLNYSEAPPEAWLLVFKYVVYIMNRTARKVLGWRTPHEALIGQTPDISNLIQFTFWEKCYIKDYSVGKCFPSSSNETLVHFAGFSESVGHNHTFLVYNPATNKLLSRSQLRKIDPTSAHFEDAPTPSGRPGDPDIPEVVKGRPSSDRTDYRTTTLFPQEMIGRTYLRHPEEDGQRFRAKVVDYIEEYEGQLEQEPDRLKFRIEVGDRGLEEMVSYNDMCEFIEEQTQNEDGTWQFRKILGHRKPSRKQAEVLIEWENGERTYEPIRAIFKGDKYLLAEYARDNDLLDEWNTSQMPIKKAAADSKKLVRMINQAKLKSYKHAPVYMYGHEVPRSHAHAMDLDRKNGNTLWRDSEALEINQVQEYDTFQDLGHSRANRAPSGYKRITLHFVYAVKHDGRYKSRIVAGGHLTDAPIESIYSGVVSLRGIRFVTFLAEHNDLDIWQTDVGNAYLESETKELVYVIAGPEFASQEGHVFVIRKALYGLKSSGLRWHERFSEVLLQMGFTPSRAEPDIWLRPAGSDQPPPINPERRNPLVPPAPIDGPPHYEYIAVYVDDLTIASKHPKAITDALQNVFGFKLKGTGPINFLLGCDYFPDQNGVLCYAPKKYIEKMVSSFESMFGHKPKHYKSPLAPGDHPEIDTSPFLDLDDLKKYQSMIGAAQWVIQLGRFDIAVHVMTLSSFRVQPRQGHLDRIKRIYGYLSNMRHSTIRIRTENPDLSSFQPMTYDWSKTPYADSREQLPTNAPPPRGNTVQMMTYADSNLMHDITSGKSVTGIIHYLNKTPVDWYSKKQYTVETATYGSEAVGARIACEQIRANKLSLLYLGVPLQGAPILAGDNQAVVDGTSRPHGKLHQRHHMLSFHTVREAIATGAVIYSFCPGARNPADILTKHWSHAVTWPMLEPVLFYQGPFLPCTHEEGE